MDKEIIEQLAAIEHQRWADWQKWVHSKLQKGPPGVQPQKTPDFYLAQWERQANTPYEKLTEKEKEMDREQVYRYLPIIEARIRQVESAAITRTKAEMEEKYRDIFLWLLGEKGEFPNLAQKPHYMFRSELRDRLEKLNDTQG